MCWHIFPTTPAVYNIHCCICCHCRRPVVRCFSISTSALIRSRQVAGGAVGCLQWRDFASLRSTAPQRASHNHAMPLDVLGGLSAAERRALGAHSVHSVTHTPSASRPTMKSATDIEQGKQDDDTGMDVFQTGPDCAAPKTESTKRNLNKPIT